jgi:hypothetical protein
MAAFAKNNCAVCESVPASGARVGCRCRHGEYEPESPVRIGSRYPKGNGRGKKQFNEDDEAQLEEPQERDEIPYVTQTASGTEICLPG